MSWANFPDWFVGVSFGLVELGVCLLVQTTVLIPLGLIAGRLARGKGAALQSAIYRTTLAAAMFCPVATLVLGALGVENFGLRLGAMAPSPQEVPAAEPSDQSQFAEPVFSADRSLAALPAGSPREIEQAMARPGRTGRDAVSHPASLAPGKAAASDRLSDWLPVLVCVLTGTWLVGTTLLLLRLAAAHGLMSRARRTACEANAETTKLCRELADRMGVRAPAVLWNPSVNSPCLVGLLHPAILLPGGAGAEEDGAISREILMHELAHLARHDCLWNLLGRLSTAILFFQPLLWVLRRRIVAAAEEVCDDCVVQYGCDRRDYAQRLAEIAERYQAPASAAAVAVVSLRSVLGRRVVRILDSSRALSTRAGRRAVLATVAVGLAATLLVGVLGVGSRPVDAAPSQTPAEPLTDRQRLYLEDGEAWTFKGRVVDPEGKPFAGATVYAARWYWNDDDERKPLDRATTNAEGRFRVSYRKSQMNVAVARATPWLDVSIVAVAEGYGPGWVSVRDVEPGHEVALRLVQQGPPIRGRVVDIEGRPIAGVAVTVGSFNASKDEDLSKWLEAVRLGQDAPSLREHLGKSVMPYASGLPVKVLTDADGRFELRGVGPERIVGLQFEGPTIATGGVSVLTRAIEPFTRPRLPSSPEDKGKVQYYGATFEHQAQPTQAIVGAVRDADTGEPLPGARVYSYRFVGTSLTGYGRVRATADSKGRYRLTGMPLGKGNSLLAVPTDDQPYFVTEKDVPEMTGGEPVTVDFELKRALFIKGRVTDAKTGEPVVAQIRYLPFLSNPHAKKYANYHLDSASWGRTDVPGCQNRYQTAADGSYRVVGLPGRGLVGVIAARDSYCAGQGVDQIGPKDKSGYVLTYCNPVQCSEKWPTAVREVNPPEDAREAACDLQLDPGQTVQLRFVDPEGEPLVGVRLDGRLPRYSEIWWPLKSDRVDLLALAPGKPRKVLCYHQERKLGAVVNVEAGPDSPPSVEVKLEPCATLTGRVLDPDGKPVSGLRIEAWLLPVEDFGKMLPTTTTDHDGRFRHEAVIPGRDYLVNARGQRMAFTTVAEKVSPKPGETIDLGEARAERR